MVNDHWKIIYSKQAQKDSLKIARGHLKEKAQMLIDIITVNPFTPYPQYEKLSGDMGHLYSRRINVQHRLVYQVDQERRIVHVASMWGHYE